MSSLVERICKLATELLAVPTSPYREQAVCRFITDFCAARKISLRQDEVGNIIAVYGGEYQNTVVAFSAHTDHPGFIADRMIDEEKLAAVFYGGVEEDYFAGARVRFFTQSGPVKGVVTCAAKSKSGRGKDVMIKVDGQIRRGDCGMWDLPACKIKGDILYSRACDDLIGCVSVLTLLDELHRRRVRKKVMAVFTVAEEAGLQGAKHLCVQRTLPRNVHLVAIETSSVLPNVRMGDGVVIRVGDRSSIFDPNMTAFLLDCAKRVQSANKGFRYQRKLMDAGTCESTVYSRFGCRNAAVCIPLGNYHNRNVRTGKIAAEYISVADLAGMVELFLAVVKHSEHCGAFLKPRMPQYKRRKGSLGEFFYE